MCYVSILIHHWLFIIQSLENIEEKNFFFFFFFNPRLPRPMVCVACVPLADFSFWRTKKTLIICLLVPEMENIEKRCPR